jgi:hypothetical protein
MNSMPKPAATRKQVVAILLGVVLLIVVVSQNLIAPGSNESIGNSEAIAEVITKTAEPLNGKAALAALLKRLPKVELEQVLAHDPFQPLSSGGSTPRPANTGLASSESATAEISESNVRDMNPAAWQVNAILHGGPRPAVMIGQQLYYERDQLESGWRIAAIHADRVTVERIEDAP